MIFSNLIFKVIKLKKGLLFLFLLITIFESILALILVYSIIPVLEFMTTQESDVINTTLKYYFNLISFFRIDYTIINSLIIFLSLTVISSLVSILLFYLSRKLGYSIVYELRSWALYKFYGQGLSFINSYSFGIMQNTFEREINKVADAIFSVFQLVSVTIFTLAMFSLSIELSASMTFVISVSFLFIAFLSSLMGSKIASLSEHTVKTANTLSSRLYNPLLNAKNILSFGRVGWAYKTHEDAFNNHARAAIKSQTLAFTLPEFFKSLSILVAVLALFYSLSIGENLTLLLATLAIFIRLLPKLANFTEAYARIKEALPSIDQYEQLFPRRTINLNIFSNKKIEKFHSSIKLDDLSFSYATRPNVLKNVSLEIQKNSFISFVGSSGSGKTTCSDLILGLYRPTSGKVLIDNICLSEINLNSYLNLIGYVQQDTILLDGSIKENLLWANPNATIDEMWESLRLVSIDEFVKVLPDALDTLVGERGVALSGGQKQRIALALALVRKPAILILDEVTSALDNESETVIRNSLKSLSHKLTIISVTHRASMVKHSDMIYVFDKGSIVEYGTYKDLKNKGSVFFNKMSQK
jgi:ATP-binding cassette, subfamily C, bacterial